MAARLPTLEYRITRTFKWPWFGTISLLGATVVLFLLAFINIPLTGYETVVTFQNDFNATDLHWFHRFMPFRIPKPGSLCDPHIFKVGDAFTTNYTFYEWSIDSVVKPNAGDSAISYKGIPLTFCDVTSIYADGDIRSWNIDFTVIVTCKKEDMFNVTARTSFSMGLLPGRYSPLLGTVRFFNDGTNDIRGEILDGIIRAAATDVGTRAYNAFVLSNFTTATIISLRSDFAFCPMSIGLAALCSISRPEVVMTYVSAVYNNATIRLFDNSYPIDPVDNPYVLDADLERPFYNLLQAVYAAIRVDLGNPSLNNFILNPSALKGIIYENFPATTYNQNSVSTSSTLYSRWNNPTPELQKYLPVTLSGPAQVQVVYPCRFQQHKPIGSLIVSVLVATLSMFSSAWAVFILVATAFAKRTDPTANRCDGHCSRHRMTVEPSWFDSYNAYGLQPTEYSGHFQGPPTKDYVYAPLTT
ncbi:hypothetical protein M413DRAFT_190109 [Hebeloma cylindrosporum]|uniref:Transmembrane protein n=1 Tax=Hebeloma cylindrosporum TaxID=76867 RepID=A0A0C3C727_HEBCY|nr:hypothetical protein M413DRAFT_190109 [Hebeloma cylindrosporum h7]